jgi:sugar (pentulose or hexulose) kinase
MDSRRLFVGIDLGTSGCRARAIDRAGEIIGAAATNLASDQADDPVAWWSSVLAVLHALLAKVDRTRVASIAADGTSGTLLLADELGHPLAPPLMYADARAVREAELIARVAPAESAAHGPTSSLAKLLWLQRQVPRKARYALHQADWIMGRLARRFGLSDTNNCLKLGYDPVQDDWPKWMTALGLDERLLPRLHPPGTSIGLIEPTLAAVLRVPDEIQIVTGTTDGVAGFIATGATQIGEAVTSLGSTLVLKILSERPVFAPEYGVYSHRLGNTWLVGGASNSGGAVLRRYFSQAEIDAMTAQLQPERPTGLDYYPLNCPGERFPRCDPSLSPRLEPRPEEPSVFLQGMLEGIAAIEREGYQRLHELGAPYPSRAYTVGGGARNTAWTRIRELQLGVPVVALPHAQAAYGAALLARTGLMC